MQNTRKLSVNENFQPFGFVQWDVVNNTVEICSYLANTLAFQTKETIQTYSAYRNLTHPDDIAHIELLAKKIREGKELYIVVESRKLCRDGTWRWFSTRGKTVRRDKNESPVRAISTLTDITNFKEKETQLKEMTLLSSEISKIKKSSGEYKETFQESSIYSKIITSLEKITNCTNSLFILASSGDFDKETGEVKKCTDHAQKNVDLDSISCEKLHCLKALFLNKNHVIHNGEETSFLGIYLDLALDQQGLIIFERETVFDNTFLDSLEPFIEVITNIIGFKRLEANHGELYNALSFFIQQVPAPVAMFDKNMCYKFASEAWCKKFNLSPPADLIGKSHYAIMPKQPKVWKEQHLRVLTGETLSCDADNVLGLFDEPIWTEWKLRPWYTLEKSIGGIMIYSNIITDRIESQNKIRDAVNNLTRSNQALDRFAHICSHDLKEPLRCTSSFINLLFRDNSKHFNEESLIYMNHVLKSIDRMGALIQDILLFSELQQESRSENVPINLIEIVHEAKESFDLKISEIGAQIKIDALPTVLGIKTQFNQLFTNLIGNAIKFRSENPLVIEVFAIEKDSFLEIHVRDNGIGISEGYQKDIFTMFKRLHSKSQYEGSGIGLATCKRIVNDHGGEIYVQSAPEGGSDFVFTLPKV
jgi:two-component system sensor kinase FixL